MRKRRREDPEIWGEQHIGQHVVAPAVEIGFFYEVGDADAQRNGSDVDKRCCDREFEAAQNPFRGHRKHDDPQRGHERCCGGGSAKPCGEKMRIIKRPRQGKPKVVYQRAICGIFGAKHFPQTRSLAGLTVRNAGTCPAISDRIISRTVKRLSLLNLQSAALGNPIKSIR